MTAQKASLGMAVLVIVLLTAASWGVLRTCYDLAVLGLRVLNVVLPWGP